MRLHIRILLLVLAGPHVLHALPRLVAGRRRHIDLLLGKYPHLEVLAHARLVVRWRSARSAGLLGRARRSIFGCSWLLAGLAVLWVSNMELVKPLFRRSRRSLVLDYLFVVDTLSESGARANLHWLVTGREHDLRGSFYLVYFQLEGLRGVVPDLRSTPRPEYLASRLNLSVLLELHPSLLLGVKIFGSHVAQKSPSVLCLLHSLILLLKADAHLVPGRNHWVVEPGRKC